MGFTRFFQHRVTGFLPSFPRFTLCYQPVPSRSKLLVNDELTFTRIYLVLLLLIQFILEIGFSRFFQDGVTGFLPSFFSSFTWIYWVQPSFTGFQWVLMFFYRFTRFDLVLLVFTLFYWVLPSFT